MAEVDKGHRSGDRMVELGMAIKVVASGGHDAYQMRPKEDWPNNEQNEEREAALRAWEEAERAMQELNEEESMERLLNYELWFYYKPQNDIGEGAMTDPDAVEAHGKEVQAHLTETAGIMRALIAQGWTLEGSLYAVQPCPPEGIGYDEADKAFLQCGGTLD